MIVPQSGQALQKPEARKKTKARKDRTDAKLLKAFRKAVWRRERELAYLRSGSWFALCQHCGIVVYAGVYPHGDVHHRIGRRAKATRYDPANGVLLCGGPNGCHRKAQEHRITV